MKHTVLFVCAAVALSACQKQAETQETSNYKLVVTLENAPFDSLSILGHIGNHFIDAFQGKKTSEFTWEFTVPDSIVDISDRFILCVSRYDTVSKSDRAVLFIAENKDKTVFGSVGIEDRENYIHAQYVEQTVAPDAYMVGTEPLIIGTRIEGKFKLILQNDSSDITVRAQEPFFSAFRLPDTTIDIEKKFYDDCLTQYVELAKKYPDSRYLIIGLASSLNLYKSNTDIRKIYDCLSNKHKNTKWGQNIEYYLFEKFENTSLPTLYRTATEKVVQDSSKYNLIVFTASWCGPCNEEIPLLKEIYHDLNEKLIVTYISVDEKETVFAFQKLMRKKGFYWELCGKSIKSPLKKRTAVLKLAVFL
ncbi:hypothetical protein AGMMS49965_24000 [Bacteroidia bacterium]|nr:hypothetical protein AGMMS49965_24000 [Bacteroidia bacterium]